MSEVINRVRDMPAMSDIERITGRGPEYYSLILRDGSVVLCTRGAYRRLFDESREEPEEHSASDVARIRAVIALEREEQERGE